MQNAIICDIDGCLLNTAHIHKEIAQKHLEGAQKWAYFEQCANNKDVGFNHILGEFLEGLERQGYKIILSTARSERIRPQTKIKLVADFNCDFELYMRAPNDLGPACEVKRKHLIQIQEKYNVEMAIDDERANLDMYSKYGLLVMQA